MTSSRGGALGDFIRAARLIVVLRRLEQGRLIALVEELVAYGARVFEITLDGPSALDDLAALRRRLELTGRPFALGAGTVRTIEGLGAARDAGAEFGVAPILDRQVLAAAVGMGLPFVPGAFSPTEVDEAWREGATFVKLFPASIGVSHLREIRAPLPEVEIVVTGGVTVDTAQDFLDAGAVAVGMGSAIINADPTTRRTLFERLGPTS